MTTAGTVGDALELPLPYPVYVAPGAIGDASAIAATVAPAHRWVVISDTTVVPLHAHRVAAMLPNPLVLDIPPGESFKTRDSWSRLTDAMLASGCGRDTTVVAVGGGVVGDLAGFVAATYMRGVPVVQLPTTLLAMVDASVGGKTAVDTAAGKNLVGAFHPPAAVIIDPEVLRTLPTRHLRAGLAEVVKHGVITDATYFGEAVDAFATVARPVDQWAGDTLARLTRLVAASVAIKARIVAADEREHGVRRTLNFGHTLGHAIEALSGYTLLHGEAVAIGMALEAEGAERIGLADAGTAAAIRDALAAAGLPTRRPAALRPADVVAATRGDKKARGGVVEYALPTRVGAMVGAGGTWSVPLDDALVLELLA